MVDLSRFSVLKQFWLFIKEEKKWWLLPLIFIIIVFGLLLIFTQGSAVAPLIYTIF